MTTTPTPGVDPDVNPKAAAKGAKAYAKAQRPWYRKKRWWVLAAVVLIVVASVLGSQDNKGPTVVGSNGQTTASSNGSKVGSQSDPAKVGQTLQLAGTRYTVRNATTAKSIGGSFGAKASGVYVVVTLTIENVKNETKTFLDSSTKFVTADGSLTYSPDDNGNIYNGSNALILQDMQPQLPTTGQIVFDVPPPKVRGGVLEVSDLFGGGSAYIKLGLR